MTGTPRIVLRIGKLRISGANQAEAQVLASALRESLAAGIAADPGALFGQSVEQLRLTLPAHTPPGPAALGQAAGRRIADALSTSSGMSERNTNAKQRVPQ